LLLASLLVLLSVAPGALLVAFTLAFFMAFANAMATNPQLQSQFFAAGLMLAFVWYLYIHLPHVIKRFLSKLFRRSGNDNHGGGHGH
jgi:membrane protein implicated in regulation of membrane protease activity